MAARLSLRPARCYGLYSPALSPHLLLLLDHGWNILWVMAEISIHYDHIVPSSILQPVDICCAQSQLARSWSQLYSAGCTQHCFAIDSTDIEIVRTQAAAGTIHLQIRRKVKCPVYNLWQCCDRYSYKTKCKQAPNLTSHFA